MIPAALNLNLRLDGSAPVVKEIRLTLVGRAPASFVASCFEPA